MKKVIDSVYVCEDCFHYMEVPELYEFDKERLKEIEKGWDQINFINSDDNGTTIRTRDWVYAGEKFNMLFSRKGCECCGNKTHGQRFMFSLYES